MARLLRDFNFDSIFHIMNRFNPEIKIKIKDIPKLEKIIADAKSKFKVRIINYHLDTNHFHLLILFPKESNVTISKFMQWVGTKIAMYINKILDRIGSVFISRFKSIIIKTRLYFYWNHPSYITLSF